MLKNMKLGAKIGLGFGGILVIAVAVGGLALWKMYGVKGETSVLTQEYIPEVEVLTSVEKKALETMYQVRGYAFTEQNSYLEAGRKSLGEVKKHLQEAKDLAAKSPHLVKLKEETPRLEAQALEYERLLNDTVARVENLKKVRSTMDEAAKNFQHNIEGYIKYMNDTLNKEIKGGADQGRLGERAQKTILANDVIGLGNAVRIANFRSQALSDPKPAQAAMGNFDQIQQKISALMPITRLEVNQKQLTAVQAEAEAYKKAMQDLTANWEELQEILKKRQAIAEQVLASAHAVTNKGMEGMKAQAGETLSSLTTASTVLLFGLTMILVLGVILSFFITRGITKTIHRLVAGLSDSSDQVSSAATQVSSSSQSLAQGASQQAAALEETSSSLEEMSSMTRQHADHASRANAMMGDAARVVDEANASMARMTASMAEISKASEDTARIIKTIDEIAFQTNLLALNAAVEAARAGEAGAGFAVVADEVRSLAMRAAEAAKNTAGLIETTVAKVKDGSDLVSKTAEDFNQVSAGTAKVKELVAEIAAASGEQSQGVSQINKAMNEMNHVTQQTAANAEESASASEELNAQAEQMKGFVKELTAMVGGSNGGDNGRSRIKGRFSIKGAMAGVSQTLHRPATDKKLLAHHQKVQGVTPEQIIPLEEGDFKDF